MSRVRIWLRKWWKVAAAWLSFLGLCAWYILRRRESETDQRLDQAAKRADDKIAVANARAAVEIAVLRGKDQQQQAQLEAILADQDEARRQAALVAMAERIRRDTQ